VYLRCSNLKYVIIAILELFYSQGPLWYSIFSYSQIFLESFAKVPGQWSNLIMIGAVAISIPGYILFAQLSDRIGRKPVMLFGMALSTIAMFPAFHALAEGANGALFAAQRSAPIEMVANPVTCTVQIDLLSRNKYATGCDIARSILTKAGVNYGRKPAAAGTVTQVHVGDTSVEVGEPPVSAGPQLAAYTAEIDKRIKAVLASAGYPAVADPAQFNWPPIAIAFIVLIIAATALYGPMAAALVELFPTSVRYTALSVPYHLAIGVVGGLMPMTAFAIATATGDIFAGLWYPVGFGAVATICCLLFLPETRGRELKQLST
jgi:MFS family permease